MKFHLRSKSMQPHTIFKSPIHQDLYSLDPIKIVDQYFLKAQQQKSKLQNPFFLPKIKTNNSIYTQEIEYKQFIKNKSSFLNNKKFSQSIKEMDIIQQQQLSTLIQQKNTPIQIESLLKEMFPTYELIQKRNKSEYVIKQTKNKKYLLLKLLNQAQKYFFQKCDVQKNLLKFQSNVFPKIIMIFNYKEYVIIGFQYIGNSLRRDLFNIIKQNKNKYKIIPQKLYLSLLQDQKLLKYLFIQILLILQEIQTVDLFILGFSLNSFFVHTIDLGSFRVIQKMKIKQFMVLGQPKNKFYSQNIHYLIRHSKLRYYLPPQILQQNNQFYNQNQINMAAIVWSFALLIIEFFTFIPVWQSKKCQVQNRGIYEGLFSQNRGTLKQLHLQLTQNPIKIIQKYYPFVSLGKKYKEIIQKIFKPKPTERITIPQIISLIQN